MADALKILSVASGEKLVAAGRFSSEIVTARLKNAPVEATLQHLAQVFDAKWRTEPDGEQRLIDDPVARERDAAAKKTEDEAILNASLQYLRRRLEQEPETLSEEAILAYRKKLEEETTRRKQAEEAKDYAHAFIASSAIEETPAWRALAALIPLVDKSVYLNMPNDARAVWAENPTQMQSPFPAGSQEILAKFRREEALLDPNLEVARVRMVVKKWELTCSFNVDLFALDRQGNTIDKAFARMNADSDKLKTPTGVREVTAPRSGETPLQIPEEAREARTVLSIDSASPEQVALWPKWRKRILDPTTFEPTSWHTAADLLATAQTMDKNMIGTPSDSISGNYWRADEPTASQFLASHKADLLPTSDDWIVYRSHEPRVLVSRSKGGSLLQDCVKQNGISVDQAAAWAGASPDRYPFINWLGDYLNTLFPSQGPYSVLSTTIDEQSLRLWDSLGVENRRSLRSGRTLSVGELPPPAKSQLERIAYWFDGLDGANLEPTETLPNGIGAGSVTMTVSEKAVFVAWSSKLGPPLVLSLTDAKGFGRALALGNTYREITADTYRSYDRFQLGTHRSYDLHFVLQPGDHPMSISLSETFFDRSGEALTELPPAIRAEVDKARAEASAKPAPPKQKDFIPPGR